MTPESIRIKTCFRVMDNTQNFDNMVSAQTETSLTAVSYSL